MLVRPPISTLFPYTTLFRSLDKVLDKVGTEPTSGAKFLSTLDSLVTDKTEFNPTLAEMRREFERLDRTDMVLWLGCLLGDRKSTRLNSSHANISYAVFCLKK